MSLRGCLGLSLFVVFWCLPLSAQKSPPEEEQKLRAMLSELQTTLEELTAAERKREEDGLTRSRRAEIADVEIFAKSAEWILRHDEFFKPNYVKQTEQALKRGAVRAEKFAAKSNSWGTVPGTKSVLGYYSQVDGSAQPYALTLPRQFDPDKPGYRWPLHVVLHGRAATMNEVNFIDRHEGKPAPESQDWVQIDVFGRTNNAYRWSGETDVFEAIRDVQRRIRIDDKRITLRGFSMGGAGAWHLGLHHPSRWCSVGPGAGFVETYKYQKIEQPLADYQHRPLGIYDAIDYVLNASNVPVCTYGGELDAQLAASTQSVEAANRLGVEIKLIVGPETGHKFHPESEKEFMAFHLDASRRGRPGFPGLRKVRFTTRTLRYNKCEWLQVEEMIRPYEPVVVAGEIHDDGIVRVTTENVSALRLYRDIGRSAEIDGVLLPLADAADNLLPDVLFVRGREGWRELNYDDTRKFDENADMQKRPGLQGPIDDAFMDSFVCVRGTGKPWSVQNEEWSNWVLNRFEREFDKWLRGKIRVVNDSDVTEEIMQSHHLILFGDPGSNGLIAKVLQRLPISWTTNSILADGKRYDAQTHGLAMIHPNPLNPRRYVVINSGHTFHEKQFKASNAQLYPRWGDFAILDLAKNDSGSYDEEIVFATIFNSGWRFPSENGSARRESGTELKRLVLTTR